MKVGFIGLGLMGASMALNLRKAGHELIVHDIKRDAGKPQYMKVSLWLDLPSLQFRTSHKLYRPQRYVEFDGAPVYAVQPEPEAIDDEIPEEDRF